MKPLDLALDRDHLAIMALDPQVERELRNRFGSGEMTRESLATADRALDAAYDSQERHENTVKWIRIVAGFLATLAFGFVFDRLCIAFGMPEEWLMSHILMHAWHSLF